MIHKNSQFCEFFDDYKQNYSIETYSCTEGYLKIEDVVQKVNSHPYNWVIVDMDIIQSKKDIATLYQQSSANKGIIPLIYTDNEYQMTLLTEFKWPHILRKPLSPYFLFSELAKLSNHKKVDDELKPEKTIENIKHISRVLVAEDNPVNQMVVCGLLKKFNIETDVMDNGLQTLEKYKINQNYDAILMDCEMPVMDGLECTKRIREYETVNAIKPTIIIALTAHALEDHKNAALNSGMDLYLSKPLTLPSLEQALRTASDKIVQ